LSPAERAFYLGLAAAVGDRVIVCPKVRLGDILYAADRSQSWKYINRVNPKYFDFLPPSAGLEFATRQLTTDLTTRETNDKRSLKRASIKL